MAHGEANAVTDTLILAHFSVGERLAWLLSGPFPGYHGNAGACRVIS